MHDIERTSGKGMKGRLAGFIDSLPRKHVKTLRDLAEARLQKLANEESKNKSPAQMNDAEFEHWSKRLMEGSDG